MHKCIFSCLLVLSVKIMLAQDKVLPKEARRFVLPGYEMLDYITGDLNNDGKKDAILIQKIKGEDSLDSDEMRPAMVLVRQQNGKLKKAAQNDNVILGYNCGGVYGDPYAGTDIKNNSFCIHFYGGSSWRWSNDYTFSFNAAKKNWYLTLEESSSYHATEMEETQKDERIEKEELGEIPFASFSSDSLFEKTKWKVTAAKAFFYDNPKTGSKHRKGYLLKGDVIEAYRETKNFVAVNFENKKAQSSSGFILKKDLIKLP